MNRLGVARDALVNAIAPVLSGRVYPYPPNPTEARVAPAVWIEDDEGHRDIIGERTSVIVTTFPIWIVYDGADRAQVAGLSQIKSGIIDAVAHVPGAEVSGWRPQPLDFNSNRRASILTVDYMITATTLCLPDVGGDVIHAADDVVEGAQDVVFHGPIAAATPPAAVSTPVAGGDPIEPPDQVPTP